MRVRMTIGRRIGLGFGLFIFFALVVVVLTNRTIERSRTINQQINSVYGPSVDALVRLRNLVVNAKTLTKHWALVESIPDAPEKTALLKLTDQDLPLLIDRIDTLQSWWDKEEVAAMNRTFQDMSVLFALQDSVQRMLPGFESYKDPVAYFNARDLAEEGGALDRQTDRVVDDLDGLIAHQSRKREVLRDGMIESLDSLRFFVLYLGSGLVAIGAVLAFFLVRGIVRPLQQLRTILLQLGKGIFPPTRVAATNDEIGDMSIALTGLVDGLRRTTDFSHAVAAGDFKAEYQPLSNDDVLGHALLMMRKELGERERVLEEKVRERTEEMVRQKDEVERQSKRVVELYKNVTDSIRYAKRLQESILPTDKRISELLPGSFVLYRPKDIVSGDFYWVEAVGGLNVFAAVDCTGHGVPGAFMSLVGHNGLNRVVKEGGRTKPGEILELLNRIATDTLHKDRDQFVRDGMDMALCTFNPQTRMLEYAGANCPMYLVRDGELRQFAPTKSPIGGSTQLQGVFTTHLVQLQEGDAVYIFSDGFADQFGGPKGKKFLYRRFREILLNIAHEPPERKKALLQETFSEWKGMREQVDDILVMGMQV